jgi:hypothetical protein
MNLRLRLQKLERTVLVRKSPQTLDAARQPYAEQHEAYLRDQGPRPPDPPCPRGTDPAAWDSQMRVGRCVDARLTGELPDGEYLPAMGQEERRQVDGNLEALAAFARRRMDARSCTLAFSVCTGMALAHSPFRKREEKVSPPA